MMCLIVAAVDSPTTFQGRGQLLHRRGVMGGCKVAVERLVPEELLPSSDVRP